MTGACAVGVICRRLDAGHQIGVPVDLREGRRPCCLEFIFFKVHINFEFGGVPMPLTGAIPEGPSFFCPHCGALYAVTYSRLFSSESNVAKCVVCGQIMDKWDSTKVPAFRLVHRPEDH
jgi:hypothetical protein